MPVAPASRYSWQSSVDRVEGDRAVGRERRDERDVDPAELEVARHAEQGNREGPR